MSVDDIQHMAAMANTLGAWNALFSRAASANTARRYGSKYVIACDG